ncbi:MAG: DDE-type integrase/transposase/recombinase [Elusimicrobiota bacterium]|nr:DDE-type integrase/transposase/recombinase [Elusimicrobiota bacterium]
MQADSVHLCSDGINKYLLTAIDIKSRFACSESYNSLNSKNAQDFMQKLQMTATFKINRVQTDNGKEFEKHFHDCLKDNNLIHYHNYPKCPKSNAYVERFNRTL